MLQITNIVPFVAPIATTVVVPTEMHKKQRAYYANMSIERKKKLLTEKGKIDWKGN